MHVVRPDALDRLDQVLVEIGAVEPADLEQAEGVRAKTGLLLGQVLRHLGLLDSDRLVEVLRYQLKRKITRLFSSRTRSVQIVPMDHRFAADASSPGIAIEPSTLVFPGILANYDENRLLVGLTELGGRWVRLKPIGEAQLAALGFGSIHGPLLSHLSRIGYRVENRWIHTVLGPRGREAKSVLLALHYLDLLDFPEEAGCELPSSRDPGQGGWAAPTNRSIPITESGALSLDREDLVALAERYFKNGDLLLAEQAFEQAAKLDPSDTRLRAFLAWIAFRKEPEARRHLTVEFTLRTLLELIRDDRGFAYGHYFIGKLLQLSQRANVAEMAFRFAADADPELIEAKRELSLLNARRVFS